MFQQYGRLHEYLQPSKYLEVLKNIIGIDTYYANLCDTMEDAMNCINLLKNLRYEFRETFIVFENHSHSLKNTLMLVLLLF